MSVALKRKHRSAGDVATSEQRVLLHNVSWKEYEKISDALPDRPALRLTYDRGNLEIMMTGSPPARAAWTTGTHHLLLHDIAWPDYVRLLEAFDQHHLRTTYDRGSLEIMTLSSEHEDTKNQFRMFIQVLAEEFEVVVKNLGSTTYRRKDRERGLEPDECFYIANWPKVRGKSRIDLSVDPPPDLAIEVDITHSSLDRMAIYAALGVPELWRFDGTTLHVYCLGADGEYEERDRSPTFPKVDLAELARFVRRGAREDNVTIAREFRAWVRKSMAKGTRGKRK